ncbi:hypothetical protein O181_038595 [Austropuccinia psidii MF-1]|uniref:Uncharacterized protein n=1 Tax=Austropuccinia psidii MF-1 TaxID=1389203 RepID=A0A9Q3HEA3_9BASI|nr:hypothetical protein [Austropuccinia psidii MF-1]
MADITPIVENLQDAWTEKVPFNQIANIQGDDQNYEDPLEFKDICGTPQGAKNKNKKIKIKKSPPDLKSLKVNPRGEGDPHQKQPAQEHQDLSQFPPL